MFVVRPCAPRCKTFLQGSRSRVLSVLVTVAASLGTCISRSHSLDGEPGMGTQVHRTDWGWGDSQEKSVNDMGTGEGAKQGCGPSCSRLQLAGPYRELWSGECHSVSPTCRPGGCFRGAPETGPTRGSLLPGVVLWKKWESGAVSSQHAQQLEMGVTSTGGLDRTFESITPSRTCFWMKGWSCGHC